MTFIEAIRTGRPLRRKTRGMRCHPAFLGCHGIQASCWNPSNWYDPGYLLFTAELDKEDVLAEDWEVEEKPVSITATQYWEAYRAVMVKGEYDIILRLAQELGLQK